MSQLPQPKNRTQAPAKLGEMSESASNARASNMPPPPAPIGTNKRKTLAEKAGEPIKRPAPMQPGPRPLSAAGKLDSKGPSSNQASSSSTLFSMRPSSSTYSRNNSLSNSASSAHRATSSHSRPQSAMDGSRILHKAPQTEGRSLTSFGMRFGTGGVVGNPEGMPPISSCPNGNPRGHKEMVPHRSNGSHRSNASSEVIKSRVPSSREVSLCNAMHDLSIDEISLQSTLAVVQDVPVTPSSQIPRLVQTPTCTGLLTQTRLPQAEAPSPSKSSQKPPKALPKFLTRDSNTELAGWDHDSRLHQVESNFAHLKGEMTRITDERSSMKDMIAMYKTKSRSMHIQI